jgi:hypothetical protein
MILTCCKESGCGVYEVVDAVGIAGFLHCRGDLASVLGARRTWWRGRTVKDPENPSATDCYGWTGRVLKCIASALGYEFNSKYQITHI